MKLRDKTLLCVCGSLLVSMTGLFLAWQYIVVDRFGQVEKEYVNQNMERAVSSVDQDITTVATAASDWAIWDDTYIFAEDRNQDYIDSNFQDSSFNSLRMNLILILDTSGEPIHGQAFDLESDEMTPVPSSFLQQLSSSSPLVQHQETDTGTQGILTLPEGPMLVAAEPILNSQGEGPIHGTLIMARHFDADELEYLGALTLLPLTSYLINDVNMPSDFQAARDLLAVGDANVTEPLSDDSIASYALLNDVDGTPSLILRADMPRYIHQTGQDTIVYGLAAVMVAGVVFGVMIVVLLEKTVLSRLAHLGRRVESIGQSGDVSQRVPDNGRDEISGLGVAVNKMLTTIQGAQAELARSEQMNRAMLQAMPDTILQIRKDGLVEAYKPASEDGLFAGSSDCAGKSIRDLTPGKLSDEIGKNMREALGTGAQQVFDYSVAKADGSHSYEARMAVSGKDEVLTVIRDVTERKLYEMTLVDTQSRLETMVNERTLELKKTNEQLQNEIAERAKAGQELQQALEDLERSNRDLQQYAYVTSHDLQEPLRMVGSYLGLLAERYKGSLDSDADEFITFAVDGANRMRSMIQDLLAYSRVGTQGKSFQATSCETAFKQATDNLKPAIEESDAVITHEPLPTVMGDGSQLTQVFQNLLGNAIKFRGTMPPRIGVSVAERERDWLFSVRDNGIGIHPQYGQRIFVVFQRLNRREEYPGSGIGLAICKRIIERHGGIIWVESELGKGAAFQFTLPKTTGGEHGK